jgi:hypothetical protein
LLFYSQLRFCGHKLAVRLLSHRSLSVGVVNESVVILFSGVTTILVPCKTKYLVQFLQSVHGGGVQDKGAALGFPIGAQIGTVVDQNSVLKQNRKNAS